MFSVKVNDLNDQSIRFNFQIKRGTFCSWTYVVKRMKLFPKAQLMKIPNSSLPICQEKKISNELLKKSCSIIPLSGTKKSEHCVQKLLGDVLLAFVRHRLRLMNLKYKIYPGSFAEITKAICFSFFFVFWEGTKKFHPTKRYALGKVWFQNKTVKKKTQRPKGRKIVLLVIPSRLFFFFFLPGMVFTGEKTLPP